MKNNFFVRKNKSTNINTSGFISHDTPKPILIDYDDHCKIKGLEGTGLYASRTRKKKREGYIN